MNHNQAIIDFINDRNMEVTRPNHRFTNNDRSYYAFLSSMFSNCYPIFYSVMAEGRKRILNMASSSEDCLIISISENISDPKYDLAAFGYINGQSLVLYKNDLYVQADCQFYGGYPTIIPLCHICKYEL